MANPRKSALGGAPHGVCSWPVALAAASLGVLSACNGGNPGNNMNMDMDMNSGGDMTGGPPITVTVTRQGSGVVSSQPAGIDCGGAGTCSAMFPSNVPLELTAQGQGGTAFAGWTGPCAGQSAICRITPTADVAVTANFSPLACTGDGLCWEAPLPFGMNLRDVSAVAANDVWAVGAMGTILHYDGTRWSITPSGTLEDLQGISASPGNNAWIAGGNNGLVLRWNGTSWGPVTTGSNVFTTGVYSDGPASVIVTELSAFALHYAAAGAWTRRQAASRTTAAFLRGISGTSGSNVWVYGDDFSVSSWNGSGWTFLARSYTPQGIYTSGPGVAYMQHLTSQMYRINGTTYQMPPTAPTADISGASGIIGLWGINANNIFTAGPGGVLYRFDGTNWSTIQTPAKEVGIFAKGSGTAANSMWLVGPRGTVAYWDGTKVTSDRANVFAGEIKYVWGSSASDVWFVTDKATLIHYNGVAYQESAPMVTGTNAALYGISGSGPSDIWLCAGENNKAVMFHYDGKTWTRSPLPSPFDLESSMNLVYAASPTLAWAFGGSFTTPLKWNGTAWQLDTLSLNRLQTTLWGSGPSNVFVAGGGDMARWDGTSWSRTGMLTATVHTVAGSSATDVWAGGDGVAYRWNGTMWSAPMNISGSIGGIQRIVATSANDAWFSDAQGALYRWNGANFRQMNTSMGRPGRTLSMWASTTGLIWFAGQGVLSYGR